MLKSKKIPVSACIIAKNEAGRIERCLESLKDFDEIVIVIDSASNDETESIARSFGCNVHIEDWKGFGPQKQSAIEKCSNDWVLIIDADEAVPGETAEKISEIMEKCPEARAYAFPRKNIFHGKWMKRGDWWPDWQVRLVDRRYGRFGSVIHERWATEGKESKIDRPIEHYSFTDYSSMLKTMDRYSSIIAQDLFSKGTRANALMPVFHAFWMFIRIYFVKKGFLEGFDGFVMALLKAGGSFFKYAKLLEIQRSALR